MLRRVVWTFFVAGAVAWITPCVFAAPAANVPTAIPTSAAESAPPPEAAPVPPTPVDTTAADEQKLKKLARQLADGPPAQPLPESRPLGSAAAKPGHAGAAPAVSPLSLPAPASEPGVSHAPAAPLAAAPAAAPHVDPKENLPLGKAAGLRDSLSGASGKSAPGGWSWMVTTVGSLGVIIGLILLLRAGLSKITGRTTTSARTSVAEVLSRINLAPRSHMLIVRMGRRILVLGDSPTGLTTLANIDDPEEVAGLLQSITAADPASSTVGFTQALSRFDGQYGEDGEPAESGEAAGEARVDHAREHVGALVARLKAMSSRGVGR